ncbi:hypothetical protein MKUB_30000 [Mycobacterium kubicae]|uniref:Toll/interleukin-1 receptor domain-containing protein n=1 Tax=Mycobacterium kubicae TaxID=120959 RepID=A0AAX1JC93_9MYCO|nr:toll/interleukin-1 receptor domain-containing protein [Mycobacterium kubicae]MCV7094251.1 toll/interleukin-1 receptor domain-containing protein [Mycobacterium kubicae]QNI09940.1 toll/interleukin-1 receptor domain-containing protein [Mycobacterium kubicae]QPI38137.1 toll/interleukin-1 receptor domain-containing protein [Mycobacterium kubicae]GFG65510.1 hypothetical protein MKUB_30000 [Mycobacterium kubicae]
MAHSKDFFISYNKANRAWAEWIAWVLEAEGYRTVVQDWDFKPGGNFVVEMDTATKECARTIAVLSQDYLDAEFTVPEWAAQFATDPKGLNRRLVPVRVDSCDIEGLLGQVIYCDLVGLDEEASRKRLLSQLSPGRTKPAVAPPFPGASSGTPFPIPKQPSSSSKRALWRPLAKPIHPQWRGDTMHGGYSRSTLELHSIPIDQQTLEARSLRELANALPALGRQSGLFDQTEAVEAGAAEDRAEAHATGAQGWRGSKGIAVERDRGVSSWLPLPHGSLGSVFDEEDVSNRLVAALALHASTGLHEEGEVALALSIEPISMLMVGRAGEVETRSSAQLLYTMAPKSALRIEPTDSVPVSALGARAAEIAHELTARLVLRLAAIR